LIDKFIITLPKSGTHMVRVLRKIPEKNHTGLYVNGGMWSWGRIRKEIHKMEGEATGHAPYTKELYEYLTGCGVHICFVWRDLRDVSVARMFGLINDPYLKMPIKTIDECEDKLLACIREVGWWWQNFSPWLDHAHAVYRFEDLRNAAFLMGRENKSATFRHGGTGEWKKYFQPHHIEEAKKLFDMEALNERC
jgi:hypothetical protein